MRNEALTYIEKKLKIQNITKHIRKIYLYLLARI